MTRTLVAAIVLAAGCQDYGIGSPADKGGDPTATTPSESTPTTSVQTCDLHADKADSVPVDPTCEGDGPVHIVDPWDLKVEWQWDTPGTGELGAIVMPAVGNLTDDDGDGRVTANDDPDVVFTTWTGGAGGHLVALNGVDGSEIFTVDGYNGNAGVAVADVTGDGWPEAIALTSDGRVAAVDRTGTPIWTSPVVSLSYYPQPTVADLDNDGDVEVIFDSAIVAGKTGNLQATISGVTSMWRTPAVADLDLDGTREIVLGDVVARPDGTTKWTNPAGGYGDFAAIADVDGDPEGEVLFVSGSTLWVQDADGSPIGSYPISGTNPGPPAVADFDGDGDVEIAIPANYTISVYETDGTLDWSAPIQDGSGLAGCSGYDVDGDGAYEVLYGDETDFWIFDGVSGAVLYDNPAHDSGTLWEYPVIADVDNDGSAEIVLASNSGVGGYHGVEVFGHAGSGWPKSGPTWGTHDFALTNLNPDGSVPTSETPSWQTFNVFRARPTVDQPGSADPFLTVGDPCVTECAKGGVAQIPWQIGNAGGADLVGGTIRLSTRKKEVDTEIAHHPLDPVAPGDVPKGGVFEVDAGEILHAKELVVTLQVGGIDCHPGDTEVVIPNPCH